MNDSSSNVFNLNPGLRMKEDYKHWAFSLDHIVKPGVDAKARPLVKELLVQLRLRDTRSLTLIQMVSLYTHIKYELKAREMGKDDHSVKENDLHLLQAQLTEIANMGADDKGGESFYQCMMDDIDEIYQYLIHHSKFVSK